MSVDVSACLTYGWIVEHEDLTERFFEMRDADFECADGMLGESYGYELVSMVDAYNEKSAYDISIPIKVCKKKYDGDGKWIGYEGVNPGELADECLKVLASEQELVKLYEVVMGEKPKTAPTVNLYENWW